MVVSIATMMAASPDHKLMNRPPGLFASLLHAMSSRRIAQWRKSPHRAGMLTIACAASRFYASQANDRRDEKGGRHGGCARGGCAPIAGEGLATITPG